MASKCSKVAVKYEANTGQGTLLATWGWSKAHTDKYKYQWQYSAGQGWFLDSEGSVDYRNGVTRSATISVKENAKLYRFRVRPIAKTHEVTKNKKKVTEAYFSADWSTWVQIDIRKQKPDTPSAPSATLNAYNTQIIASIDISLGNSNINRATKIVFQLWNATTSKEAERKTGTVNNATGRASVTFNISNNGCAYRVRCYAIDADKQESSWSIFQPAAPDCIRALPTAPSKIKSAKLVKSTDGIKTVELSWDKPSGKVDGYKLQYTTDKKWFDKTNKVKSETPTTTSWVFDLSEDPDLNGNTWFFRLCSVNETGDSGWSPIASLTVGEKPNSPTTWSSTATAVVGDKIDLYWVHNTVDGSKETVANLQLIVDGVERDVIPIMNTRADDETIGQYAINTDDFPTGAKIEWKVQTKGIYVDYSDWSVTRVINVVAKPTLEFNISQENNWYWDLLNFNTGDIFSTEGSLGDESDTITKYPIYISALAGPPNQNVLRWYLSIVSNDDSYESMNDDGTVKIVNKGDILYSKHFDNDGDNRLFLTLSPTDVLLQNNASYLVTVRAVMNTGLSIESEKEINLRLEDDSIDISAAISIDEDLIAAYIHPIAINPEDENETPLSDVYFSVFRINYDGTLTEIESKMDSSLNGTAIDLHPALDKARYRIVAISKTNGTIVYEDFNEAIEDSDIIIQWNEHKNEEFIVNSDDATDQPAIAGEFLRLPWNIDTTEEHDKDVEFVEYIGREHPVDYHGTQLGETATWNTDVDKEDVETIYALRRLAIYKGHVYVRNPSGVGYWAVVKVSMSDTHGEMVIPVTLSITRVEGGA